LGREQGADQAIVVGGVTKMSTGIKLKYRKNINQKMAQSATRMTPQIWWLGGSNSCQLMG